jgi:hypothetical protein
MKNIELLPIDELQKENLKKRRNMLAKATSIYIDILEIKENAVKISVEQKAAPTGYILTQKELIKRAEEMFLDFHFQKKFIPVTFIPDLMSINHVWVEKKLIEFDIKPRDLSKQIGIDKSTLSILLKGTRKLTKSQQAAFYYYFLTFELNRDFRNYLNNDKESEGKQSKINEVRNNIDITGIYRDYEFFVNQMELLSLRIIQKILQKKQQNDLADAIFNISQNIVLYTSIEGKKMQVLYIEHTPMLIIADLIGLARIIKNTIEYYSGTSKEDLIQYIVDWCGVTENEFENAINVCNLKVSLSDLNDAMEKVSNFTRMISALFSILANLEYIGKKKEAGIFVKEQLISSQEEDLVKKRRSFLAD